MKNLTIIIVFVLAGLASRSAAQGYGSASLWGLGNNPAGTYCAAGGYGNYTAPGIGYGIAFGYACQANGYGSTAIGSQAVANGPWSMALGVQTAANGYGSLATGYLSLAGGTYSFASGLGANAASLYSASFGSYPVIRGNATAWVTTDPLFTVSNGQSATARSNAMVVLKNGAVLIKPAGDISMGAYTAGIKPDDTTP